jgi:hypothetical protein
MVAPEGTLDLPGEDQGVARVLLSVVERARSRSEDPSLRGRRVAVFRLSELRSGLFTERIFQDPSRLLSRLRRRGLLEEDLGPKGDRIYRLPAPAELLGLLRGGLSRMESERRAPLAGWRPPPDERVEVEEMDQSFFLALQEVLAERLEETVEFGRTFSLKALLSYAEKLFGEQLYLDPVLAILQQYALADVPLLAPGGRPTGTTGFHLALFGPPGTGKTFAIDDFIRGNARNGVPAHGLPGRNRYCGGITPAQFLRLGAHYQGRTFNFVVPEFNDWFKYRGMVEPLKLVMEQREVKYETTFGTVGPYTFRSFFSVNYNVRVGGGNAWESTISDPNFVALEDRMLLRFHRMTRERFRAVEQSAERLELGEMGFDLAERIRDHLTLVYAIETGHPLVREWPKRGVALSRGLYTTLREVSERALARTASPRFSPRLRGRAVKLAAASALLGYFSHPKGDGALPVGREEESLAQRFYQQEIDAREGHS